VAFPEPSPKKSAAVRQLMIRQLFDRLAHRGFEGPLYTGFRGKARFLFESVVGRTDLVFVATTKTVTNLVVPNAIGLQLQTAANFTDLKKFREALDAEYYFGYVERWRAPFTWGERAAVGTVDGSLASFAWIQDGTSGGFPTYYGRLLEREARILRLGVLPSFRRRGLSALTLSLILESLFASGVERVYIECHRYNLPSVRSFLRSGFRPIGAISVVEIPGVRGFVRWKSLPPIAAELRTFGIELNVATVSP
jgi:GNAT superfamily N-acetyltransferase